MTGRIYDTARWKRLRKRHLAMFPLCQPCAQIGRVEEASHVDHRIAISQGGPAYPDHDGLESMCPPCHSAKTARGGEHGAVKSDKPRKGCDANGNPLDPTHEWHRGGVSDAGSGAGKRPPPILPTQLVSRRNPLGGRHG